MSLRSLRARVGRAQPRELPSNDTAGQSLPIPSPTLGMNSRDGVASLDPREARSIRNMIAENGRVVIRKGKTLHQTIPMVDAVGSMFTHEGVSANVILAAAGGEIYDVTGTPDALTSASYTLDVWSIDQLNDTTIGVNGTDVPWAFDGTTVGATGLSGSGLTIANLRTIHVVRDRIWFTEENSADVWYLSASAITGVLTKFNLSNQTKGGYCVGIYGFGPYTVFVMSAGEIVTYSGDVQTDFTFNKRYDAPRPVGYDPGKDIQGDLVIMTTAGTLPYEAIAAGVSFDTSALQTWGKIAPSWTSDFVTYGANPGWNCVFFMGLVIFTVQTDTSESKQWCYNTKTKAWSFFDSLDGYQFTEFGGSLYFGDKGSGAIWINQGGTDDGAAIVGTIRHSFTYPFQSQVNGQFTLARLNVLASGTVTGQIQVDVDFGEQGIMATEYPLSTSGSGPWDGVWDGAWGEDGEALKLWSSVSGYGRAVAPVVQFNSQADDLQYFAVDLIAGPAGVTG